MTFTASAIRRAVRQFSARKGSVRDWSSRAVDRALDYRGDAGTEAEKAILYAIDQVAYGMRWCEMTGRANYPLFGAQFAPNATYVESMVRTMLRSSNQCADTGKEIYKGFAELHAQRQKERAA